MLLSTLGLSFVVLATAVSPFQTEHWAGTFDSSSGVLQSLRPASDPSFDFSPADVFASRNGVGNYHTGDITLRWRAGGEDDWNELDTAVQRATAPSSMNSTDTLLSSSFSALTANASEKLTVTRSWKDESGDLVLQITIGNPNKAVTIELGAFGLPIEFNNIFTGRDAIETSEKCVLVDPYIGLDAGYLQVTRLLGTGPAMIITPYGNSSKFEAWRFLQEPSTAPLYYQSQTFEGHYAWQMLSKAYAENEWNATEPWNDATSEILQPGQNVTFGLRFSPVQDIPSIESAVASKDVPVAIGIPGYTLASDMTGKLFLRSSSDVVSITSKPAGALTFSKSSARNASYKAYDVVSDGTHGRARADIEYADGRVQTVHYYLLEAAPEHIAKHARFLFNDQWMGELDAFNRSPGIITYDWAKRAKVEQDSRVWIAGLQDEGGSASYVAAALKTAFHPLAEEVRKLEEMATTTMWGNMQYNTSDGEWPMYTVKRSLFYYDPEAQPDFAYDPALDWTTWASWNKTEASQVWRPYNYVWVSSLYWALYHAEKVSPGVLTLQNATWYLEQAYHTAEAWYGNTTDGQYISDFRDVGFMGETVWQQLLNDLEHENMTEASDSLRSIMKERQAVWSGRADPFGSEMAWDSTGQEGVYIWSKYFNDSNTVEKTLASIRGYMPTVAHWAWDGNARRYWDFSVAGGIQRIERQVHHYGSPLNAIPLLDNYQYNPEPTSSSALHDLRVGYGGWLGALTNINEEGFGAQAFHAWPDTLEWDPYSSDYGCGLLGHMLSATTYLVESPDFGFISFGGNVQESGSIVTVQPRDTVRRRVYVAPLGLRFEVDVGTIQELGYDTTKGSLAVKIGTTSGENGRTANIKWKDTLGKGVRLMNDAAVTLPAEIHFAM